MTATYAEPSEIVVHRPTPDEAREALKPPPRHAHCRGLSGVLKWEPCQQVLAGRLTSRASSAERLTCTRFPSIAPALISTH